MESRSVLIISAGLPKSGSALYFNLTNDLLIAAGGRDVRELKARFRLEDILNYYNCNLEQTSTRNVARLYLLNLRFGSFVVKTHSVPTSLLGTAVRAGLIRVTCTIRDPRDVLLSAMEHGKKILASDERHTFASCSTVDNTLPQVTHWLNATMAWLKLRHVHLVKYEDLISDPVGELERLASFLRLPIERPELVSIFSKYRRENLDRDKEDYLHYNIGLPGRFRDALSSEQIGLCNRQFDTYLKTLQYDRA